MESKTAAGGFTGKLNSPASYNGGGGAKQFIATFSSHAQQAAKVSGVPASITMAQAILESGSGNSGLARNANNFFGIKANGWDGKTVTMKTGEYRGGKNVTESASFRAYTSPTESFIDHANFLKKNSRYKKIFTMTDPYKIADELQRAGYATDPNYANKLKQIIKTYDLTKYDNKAILA